MEPNIIRILSEPQAGVVILSILVLLLAALAGGRIAAVLRLPKVAGEILGGIAVGPTVLGWLSPADYDFIFRNFAEQGAIVSIFYWLGLILLMFTSGYEATLDNIQGDRKIIGWLVVGSTLLPLVAGYGISNYYFARYYLGAAQNVVVFNIIFAIAAAVTSIPVISKIFIDLGLIRHRYAKIVLAAATIQDLFLWVLLSIATSMVSQKNISAAAIVLHVAVTAAMFAFAILLAPLLGRVKAFERLTVFSYDSIFFILCFSCVYLGSLAGVNIMYSAFVAGMIFKNIRNPEAAQAQAKLRDLCLAFFIPVYFAIVGLRIHLSADFSLAKFLTFLAIVSSLELLGCLIAMRIIRLSWLASFNLGVAMNARGGPGIVLATVTYEMGIINYEFFCVMVFTSIITSAVAGWWIGHINGKGRLLELG